LDFDIRSPSARVNGIRFQGLSQLIAPQPSKDYAAKADEYPWRSVLR
jgi:hypothetical protein